MLNRWTAAEDEADAAALRLDARVAGCVPLSQIPDRERARVRGVLHTVTLQPRDGVPALEADLYDGSDVLTLIWLGRRRIPGIDCGRALVASGRITTSDGRRVMYNPHYSLLPTGAA
ncbi:MAG: OB-fold nucleic acid binding domain-containing protein [Jiangellaceae bacterium]|nr:OB-fold nucleic acid binding domain-containing protein [Jiangellaceae bacterium]